MTHVTLMDSQYFGWPFKSEWSPATQAKYPAISEVEEVRFAAEWYKSRYLEGKSGHKYGKVHQQVIDHYKKYDILV